MECDNAESTPSAEVRRTESMVYSLTGRCVGYVPKKGMG